LKKGRVKHILQKSESGLVEAGTAAVFEPYPGDSFLKQLGKDDGPTVIGKSGDTPLF